MVKKFTMMAVIVALLAVPIAWQSSAPAHAAPSQQGDETGKTITVTGYGTAYGAPDIVRLGLGVEASNQDILVAMDDVNERMNAVNQALQAGGVLAEDVRTDHFSIYQDYGFGPAGPAEQSEPVYRVSNGVRIVVRDTETVGELIEAAVSAGANMINYVEFAIEDRATLESEARALAVADAQDRAAQLAETLGLTVGEPVTIVESSNASGPPVGLGGGGGVAYEAASAPSISQGQLSVSMNVTITFALQ